MSADELKAKGNAAFSAGQFHDAIAHFTAAIELAPENHVLYSNRSAAEASLYDYNAALKDARKVTELKPDWPKGYSRLGAALFGLRRYDEAEAAYEAGLSHDASNAQLKEGAAEARQAAETAARAASARRPTHLGALFTQPEVLGRLTTDPRTRALLAQPDFMQMLGEVQSDETAFARYAQDDRLRLALEVGLGLGSDTLSDLGVDKAPGDDTEATEAPEAAGPAGTGPAGGPRGDAPMSDWEASDEAYEEARRAEAAAKAAGEPELTDEQRARREAARREAREEAEREAREQAEREAAEAAEAAEREEKRKLAEEAKARGNAAYKRREFAEAVAAYDEAYALYDGDITYISNRAAANFEAGEYELCVADCDRAVERGREIRADYKLIAKAMTRKGNALVRLGRMDEAVETFKKSLTEHRNADTLKRLQDAERAKRDAEAAAYVDLELCDREKALGNEAFGKQDFPAAIRHYSEALKRGPPGVNPEAHKLYSNRCACYTKLGAWQDGIKDADECIRLAPDFAKGYSRKGHLQFFSKEFDKARETYQLGLEKDPANAELREGLQRVLLAINRAARGEGTEQEIKERQARAMADPEIQAILTDPIMRQVLRDLEEDPAAAQKHFNHPEISKKIEKLMAAGIIRVG